MINEYCQQIARCLYSCLLKHIYIGLHQVFVYQVDVDVIISRHTQKSEMKDTYRILRQ